VRSSSALALGLSLLPTVVRADDLVTPRDPSAILGGTPVAACGWPSTVWVDVCTATLVHPSMVVLASHCIVLGGTPMNASFGETIAAPARQVPISGCVTYPGWQPTMPGDGNDDIAICQLAEPVDDVAIVPILMGCEADGLVAGADVTLVGFGVHDQLGTIGTKYAVDVAVQSVGNEAIFLGDAQASACNGDSGGPAFVQLDDGSWRVFGVTSGGAGTTPDCPQTTVYTLIHPYVDWIETTSGLDVTPCHDADGTWNPDERCTEFPLSPSVGGAQWTAGCDDGEHSGASATCGPPIGDGGSSSSDGGDSSSSGAEGGSESSGPSESSSTDTGTTDGESGGGTTGAAPPMQTGAESGCGCASTPGDPPLALLAYFGLVLVGSRRRG